MSNSSPIDNIGAAAFSNILKIMDEGESNEPTQSKEQAMQPKDAIQKLDKLLQSVKDESQSDFARRCICTKTTNALNDIDGLIHKFKVKKFLGDHLAKKNVVPLLVKYIRMVEEQPAISNQDNHCRMCVYILRNIIWNYADTSKYFAEELARNGVVEIIVTSLRDGKNYHDKSPYMTSLTLSGVSILHNIAKISPENRKYFKGRNNMEILIFYSKNKSAVLRMIAVLTLAYIVDEASNDIITADGTVIDGIIMYLENTLKNDEHKTVVIEGNCSMNFYSVELLSGLCKLAGNGHNSLYIMRRGIVHILEIFIQTGNEQEKEFAVNLTWILSFDEENKPKLTSSGVLMKFLNKYMREDYSNTSRAATTTMFVLTKMSTTMQQKNPDKYLSDGHIMISYEQQSKDIVLKIKEQLARNGFKIWIDETQMTGTEAMAKAIENSSVVLVCMSQKYKESQICKTEALYANQRQKTIVPLILERNYKPDGWLGALVGTKRFMDFTEEKWFKTATEELVKELKHKGVNVVKKRQIDSPRDQKPSGNSRIGSNRPVEQWSNVDVQEWLKQNGMNAELQTFDGQTLQSLSIMQKEHKDVFSKYVYDELGLKNPIEFVKFTSAIEKLSNSKR